MIIEIIGYVKLVLGQKKIAILSEDGSEWKPEFN